MNLALEQLAQQHATRKMLLLETLADRQRIQRVAMEAAQALHSTSQLPTLVTILELTNQWREENVKVMKDRWLQASFRLVSWRFETLKARRKLSAKEDRALERCVALTLVFSEDPQFETLRLYEEYINTLSYTIDH